MLIALAYEWKISQNIFIPPSFDDEAVVGQPIVPENLGWEEIDTGSFQVSVCGIIISEEKSADVWLTNPESNYVWIKMRVLDNENRIIGETGLIKPGEYVQTVYLDEEVENADEITIKIMSYQPDTYYSEGVVTLKTNIMEESE